MSTSCVRSRCHYRYCCNGKHNNSKLFCIPLNRHPQELWIERAGNPSLLILKPETVHTYSLCYHHFKKKDILSGKLGLGLERNANPIHWMDPVDNEERVSTTLNNRETILALSKSQQVEAVIFQNVQNQGNISTAGNGVSKNNDNIVGEEMETDIQIENKQVENAIKATGKSTNVFQGRKKNSAASCKVLHAILRCTIKKLRNQIHDLKKDLRSVRKRAANRKQRYAVIKSKTENKYNLEEIVENLNISELSKTIIQLMLYKSNTPYSKEKKNLAKQLYYYSAVAYYKLRDAGLNLPSSSTIRRWIAETEFYAGYNDKIFLALEKMLLLLPLLQRKYALKFDEMCIKELEEYCKKQDLVEGLVDIGFCFKRRNGVANTALVFCLDSIIATNPWSRILSVSFFESRAKGEELLKILRFLLQKLHNVGADVCCIVCDQASSNQKLYNLLKIDRENPIFKMDEKQYYFVWDWPHVIKSFMRNLFMYKKIYMKNEVILAVEDVTRTWEHDQSHETSNLLTRITPAHLNPNPYQKMNVRLAFQMVSHRVASAVELAGRDERGIASSATWRASAAFIREMDKAIDAMNSYYLETSNRQKRPLSKNNEETIKELENYAISVKEWYIINKRGKSRRPPCFNGIITSIYSIINIYKNIQSKCSEFQLATGLYNQDSVEHTFSMIRGRGGYNQNPSVRMTRLTMRHMLSMPLVPISRNANTKDIMQHINENYENIEQNYLENTTDNLTLEQNCNEITDVIDIRKNMKILAINRQTNNNVSEKDLYELNADGYLTGYIVRKVLSKYKCTICEEDVIENENTPFDITKSYLLSREYEQTPEQLGMRLKRPSKKIIQIVTHIYNKLHPQIWHEEKLLKNLTDTLKVETDKLFPEWFEEEHACSEHRRFALQIMLLVKIYATTRKHTNKRVQEKLDRQREKQKRKQHRDRIIRRE